MAEGKKGSRIIKPDADFSSAVHRALLDQLHAMGHAPLPASINVRLELLCLAAKVRGAPSAGPDAAARVFKRCERVMRDSLCADNCLAVLLRVKPFVCSAAEAVGLVDAAHAVVAEHVAEMVKHSMWLEFMKSYPESACEIMQDVALKQASTIAGTRKRAFGA